MDVGPKTIAVYKKVLAKAKTIVWNGPVGVFEMDAFSSDSRFIPADESHLRSNFP